MKLIRQFLILIAYLLPDTLKADAISIIQQATPAVVFIAVRQSDFDQSFFSERFRSFYEYFWPAEVTGGSGFIISPEGHIVTNAHVIREEKQVLVLLQSADRRVCKASLVGKDLRTDIAVLKIEEEEGDPFPYLAFDDSNCVQVGESVIAIGNPRLYESTATMGIVSATDRNRIGGGDLIEGHLQIDAALNPGNSGGPVLNGQGEVIGIVTQICPRSVGIGFAVSSYVAKHVVDQILSYGQVRQGFLGIALEEGGEEIFDVVYFSLNQGARIQKIIKGSPAEKAGLQKGDIIVGVNHYAIRSPESLRDQVCVLQPDTLIDLEIERQGERMQFKVELGSERFSTHYSQLEDSLVI